MNDTYIKIENSIIDHGSSVITQHYYADNLQNEDTCTSGMKQVETEAASQTSAYNQLEEIECDNDSVRDKVVDEAKDIVRSAAHSLTNAIIMKLFGL